MPALVQGLSVEENRLLENMRKMTLKHLELLHNRQHQYKNKCVSVIKNSSIDESNESRTPSGESDGKEAVAQEDFLKEQSIHGKFDSISQDKANKQRYEEVETIMHDRPSKVPLSNTLASGNAPSLDRGTGSVTNQVHASLNRTLTSKPFTNDASAIFNRSYENRFVTGWRIHQGEGDSYDDQRLYDHKLIFGAGKNPEKLDGYYEKIYENSSAKTLPDSMVKASEPHYDSGSDVITITDSPLAKSVSARRRLDEASSNPSRKTGTCNTDIDSKKNSNGISREISNSKTSLDNSREGSRKFASSCQADSVEGTPKSILRHRKMIDNNVRVESKYEHTPTTSRTRSRRGLNFSYSDIDDRDPVETKLKSVNFSDSVDNDSSRSKTLLDRGEYKMVHVKADQKGDVVSGLTSAATRKPSLKERPSKTSIKQSKKPYYATPTDGSYIEEYDLNEGNRETGRKQNETGEREEGLTGRETFKDEKKFTDGAKDLVQKNLLLHSGNDRKHASIVRELENRPKSVFDSAGGQETGTKQHQSEGKDVSKAYLEHPLEKEFSRLIDGRQGKPLLGYDWIAGLLDNDMASIAGEPDDLFEEVKEFRRHNRLECTATSRLNEIDFDRPITPEVRNPAHTCIHGYSVNERLFTEPVNVDAKGTSFCPVCLSSRKEPSQESPGFIRVSIPRSTLESPYKIKPHRRRSFDPIDSCALSQHCLAGWECSRPSSIATASTLDLNNAAHGFKSQLITTEEEARKIANSVSKTSRLTAPRPLLLPNVTLPNLGSAANVPGDATLSTLSQPSINVSSRSSTRDSRSVTDELLNTSHSLRFQLQSLEKSRGVASRNQPNSTAFPLY